MTVTPTLLLADASPMMHRVVELTFSQAGLRVVVASDGEQALARIPLERPDIVLADHALPVRSGYEVTRFVKGHAELRHIPVLLLCGAFEPVDQVRAAHAGCDGVVEKPFDPQALVATVRELLARPPRVHDPEPDDVPSANAGAEPEGVAEPAEGSGLAKTGEAQAHETRDDVPTLDALLGPADARADDSPAFTPPADALVADGVGPDTTEHEARMPSRRLADLAELADALAALRRDVTTPQEPIAPEPPAIEPVPEPVAPQVEPSHALVDAVTRQVLERLAPGAVNAVVSRVVSEIAEKLLREELDRVRREGPSGNRP